MKFIAEKAINALVKIVFSTLFCLNSAFAALPIENWTQPSGAQVFLVQSHTIPMVDVRIDFDAGSRRDPVGKAGLASATAQMWSKGIKTSSTNPALDPNELSDAWADLGGTVSAYAERDKMSFFLRSLTYPDILPKAVALASRQMALPRWPVPVWLRERERRLAGIKENDTRSAVLADRAFRQAVYGEHPYGFETTENSLNAINITDMQAKYAAQIQACKAKVSIVGAVTKQQADTMVTSILEGLVASECSLLSDVVDIKPLTQSEDKRIPFESAQAHVLIGQPGYKRDDPDFFALLVGNHILGGGGFTSRLTNEVREKRGLTYSVYSGFQPGSHAGAFTLSLQTRPDQAVQAVQVTKDVLTKFVVEGPTEAELQAAKDNLIGGFALRIDSNRKLLDFVANIAWNKLPLTYMDTWTQQIDKITTAQIKAAFQRKLQPERMVTIVLGAVQ